MRVAILSRPVLIRPRYQVAVDSARLLGSEEQSLVELRNIDFDFNWFVHVG